MSASEIVILDSIQYIILIFKFHDAFLFVYNTKYLTEIPYSPKLKYKKGKKEKQNKSAFQLAQMPWGTTTFLVQLTVQASAFTRKGMTTQQTGNNKID